MGKVGLIPCGRHHRRWCRGRRRGCLRSLWCLWFPCTSPEKKRLLPQLQKNLFWCANQCCSGGNDEDKEEKLHGGHQAVSLKLGPSPPFYMPSFMDWWTPTTCWRLQNQDIMEIIPPVVHVVVQVCRICETGAREHMNHIYSEYSCGGDPSWGLFQQIWLGCHPSDSEALISIKCF